MLASIHTCIHACILAHTNTCVHTHTHAYMHACRHAHILTSRAAYTYMPTCRHTFQNYKYQKHAHIHTYVRACILTCIHTSYTSTTSSTQERRKPPPQCSDVHRPGRAPSHWASHTRYQPPCIPPPSSAESADPHAHTRARRSSSLTSITAWKTCLKGCPFTARIALILKIVPYCGGNWPKVCIHMPNLRGLISPSLTMENELTRVSCLQPSAADRACATEAREGNTAFVHATDSAPPQ